MCVKSKYLLTNAGTVKFRGGEAWHAAAVRLYFHKLISFAIPTAKGLSILFFSCLSSSSDFPTFFHFQTYSSTSSSSSYSSSSYSSSSSARFPFSLLFFLLSILLNCRAELAASIYQMSTALRGELVQFVPPLESAA